MKVLALSCWLLVGEWRARFMQISVVIMAIALGVALGFAIHLVIDAAFNEFSAASKNLSGQSDFQVYGKQRYFDESVYPELAKYEGVDLANPVLEFTVSVPAEYRGEGDHPLKILGIDMFRAADMSLDLLGISVDDQQMDGLSDDAIFLSPAAMEWLRVKPGDMLQLNVGTQPLVLRIAGGVTRARVGQRVAVMDIGAAQWRFNYLGVLSRVDLKLGVGIHRAAFKEKLEQDLGEYFYVAEIADQETRVASMSRAYRVNLNMLSLVALFTGSFLVFSTQALSITRRQGQFALLRVLGFTQQQLLRQIIIEGIALGVIGSLVGLLLGYGLAELVIQLFDGDLGSSFFPSIQPSLHFDLYAGLFYFVIGLSVTVFGSMLPARSMLRMNPTEGLKSGNVNRAIERISMPWLAVICLIIAIFLVQLPSIDELPVFGYLAIALLLIGGIGLMPYLVAKFFTFVLCSITGIFGYERLHTTTMMALVRLANIPGQASIALSGVLVSFSLMVAMAIMVLSFRISVSDWLEHVLPADFYVRAADSGVAGGFERDEQKAINELSEFLRVDFLRYQQLVLDPERPEITLIARHVDMSDVRKTLPIVGEIIASDQWSGNERPVWVSEAMVDLYGYTVGKQIMIPLGGALYPFVVAGIWRDYGRQFGAIQIQLSDYQQLSDDWSVNTAALWMQSNITVNDANTALQQLTFGNTLEIMQSKAIRDNSLKIFDRSFAVTYLLEMIAVVIGLLGVAASFSAQMLARTSEFGMLRHIGVTRSQILVLLTTESCLLTVLGVVLGFVLGWSISLILIFIINPQSFHWTMQLYMPWGWLMLIAGIMLVSASVTALIAGRSAISGNAVRAVREDW